jgi:hypothetical protein
MKEAVSQDFFQVLFHADNGERTKVANFFNDFHREKTEKTFMT